MNWSKFLAGAGRPRETVAEDVLLADEDDIAEA